MTTSALVPRPAAAPDSPARSLFQESAPAAEPFALLMGRTAAHSEPPPGSMPPDTHADAAESPEPESTGEPSEASGATIPGAPSFQAQSLAQAVVLAAAALPAVQPPAPEPQGAAEPGSLAQPLMLARGPVEPVYSLPLASRPAILPAKAGPDSAAPPDSGAQAASPETPQTATANPLVGNGNAAAGPLPQEPRAGTGRPAQHPETPAQPTPDAASGSPVPPALRGEDAQPAETAVRAGPPHAAVEPASRERTEPPNPSRVMPPEPARERQPANDAIPSSQAPSGREGTAASPGAQPAGQPTHAVFHVGDPARAAGAGPAAGGRPAHAPQHLEVAEQVVRHLEAMRLGASRQEAVIQLEPESLGRLHIALSAQSNDLTARILAENPAARQALEDGRDLLRTALEARGFSLNSLDVGLSHHQQERGAFQRAALPQPSPPAVLRVAEHAPPPAAARAWPRHAREGLDLRA